MRGAGRASRWLWLPRAASPHYGNHPLSDTWLAVVIAGPIWQPPRAPLFTRHARPCVQRLSPQHVRRLSSCTCSLAAVPDLSITAVEVKRAGRMNGRWAALIIRTASNAVLHSLMSAKWWKPLVRSPAGSSQLHLDGTGKR
ncbi:hypothetical protein E2C01_047461 [Portunus trituberculatus]|uniref:Uncharacterized protein n=1 Tax=Portunus trituberculatus TaxID=210409 RepID=A0A5B7G800_PORTR|nr:hypothetical protein [Portunus trituberculatus]